MSAADEPSIDVLTLVQDPAPMQPLLRQLRSHGIGVDVAHDLAGARTLFFGAGGHDCLVIGPDVGPGLANRVLESLRSVDPLLPTASFAAPPPHAPSPLRTARLAAFHPGSRAGLGALLRFLRALTRR
ncbi:MAG: hypothetical protein KF830_05165 [Planctomycetes bacterium]|nr:hypothetical protein [Planctomycetota bacterium]